jgi:hypothetical protein
VVSGEAASREIDLSSLVPRLFSLRSKLEKIPWLGLVT